MTALTVEVIRGRHRLQIALEGFATPKDVEIFRRDLSKALANLQAETRNPQVLYDISRAVIQSQDVVNALRAIVVSAPKVSAVAVVNSSSLAGRQITRIFEGVAHRRFADIADALAWLDALYP